MFSRIVIFSTVVISSNLAYATSSELRTEKVSSLPRVSSKSLEVSTHLKKDELARLSSVGITEKLHLSTTEKDTLIPLHLRTAEDMSTSYAK